MIAVTLTEDQADGVARLIVLEIVQDLRGRGGLGPIWEQIDGDTKTRIHRYWVSLAKNALLNEGKL